ncbi:hypothetical protein LTR78_006752 [Recurvomyces mirabilis]|uniref:Cytochrome P450 n=2 Tax=Recurvomyces mirabilis TaxID=574656 RepID=A0AAE0WKS3_9PEZI|nr:hypothetical protein LTR78_006752 [Recurvomyces mirabilis]
MTVGRRDRRMPEGPPTLPIIGNLHQMPKVKPYLQFTKWARTYGGMYTLKLGSGSVVVLTNRRLVKQLLDKKSATSSHRPVSLVQQEMITEGSHMLWMNNTPKWRLMRKLVHQDLTEVICDREHSRIHQAESIQLLNDMLEFPDEWMRHLKRFSNSIIMSIVYGIRSPSNNAPWTKELNGVLDLWAKINEFGATPPIDIFPFLKWIPQRYLGNWVTRTKIVHDKLHELYDKLLRSVEARREATGPMHCIADRVLDQNGDQALSRHNVMFLAGVALKGGSDTTASTLASFVQAMIAFPEVQRKAHAELDAVIGPSRIPDWNDYATLPYVAALVKETMRWRPTAPLGVPHALSEDEWVDGKFLPKGTVVFVNVWGLHHDEHKFPDSDTFDPGRYTGRIGSSAEYANSADYENRDHYGFGNGRRLCPGIHLADRNVWHVICKMLWAFEIKPKFDAQTSSAITIDTSVETGYREGLTMCPYDFQCDIQVRDQARAKLIASSLAEAKADVFPKYERTEFFMPTKA